jgi:S-adenosylmethionine synthetase
MKVTISALSGVPPCEAPLEVVERKGTGHPDSICDAIAEELSVALSQYYLDQCGLILHHNVDKGLLWGGAARVGFGGGEIERPLELFLAGRATMEFRGTRIPVDVIAIESTQRWLKANLSALDCSRHVRIHCLFRPSSAALVELYTRQRDTGVVLANDTSIGVGFAPLDTLERMVLGVERHLNSPSTRSLCPAIGTDIKVMGVRDGGLFRLTIACAFVAAHVRDMGEYHRCKAVAAQLALRAAREASSAPVEVTVNAADGDTEDSLYLTVTGTSAEAGDDGEVGRGNRVNGLITPQRPMSLEAAAGKNPVSHVGKLYNVAAHRIAQALVTDLSALTEAHCMLVSAIGAPIDQPQAVDIGVRLAEGAAIDDVKPRVSEIVSGHLATLNDLWCESIRGAIPVW